MDFFTPLVELEKRRKNKENTLCDTVGVGYLVDTQKKLPPTTRREKGQKTNHEGRKIEVAQIQRGINRLKCTEERITRRSSSSKDPPTKKARDLHFIPNKKKKIDPKYPTHISNTKKTNINNLFKRICR